MPVKRLFVFFLILMPFFPSGAKDLRIVSFSPALTELIYRLDAGSMLAGRSSVCDEPADVLKVPVAGGYASPNIEKTASLTPDLILSDMLWPPESEKMLRSLKCEVIVKRCDNLSDYREWVLLLGEKLGRRRQAEAECARIDAALKEFAASSPGQGFRAVWLLGVDPLIAAGSGSLPDAEIGLCGAENAAAGKAPYFRTSFEWLLKTDPDVIIVLHSGCRAPEILARHSSWHALKAVKNKRVVSDIPENTLLRPGPRLIEGIRSLRQVFSSFRKE